MYDIGVIGGGPGGYVAAIRAAQLGAKVVLIERESLGGVCLNWGCIPTKALLESAELFHKMKHSELMGISCNNLKIDMQKIVQRSRDIVGQLTSGVAHLMKKNNIDIIKGHGRIVNNKLISIDHTQKVQVNRIIIATGARNKYPPNIKVDGDNIWDCRHAMQAKSLPKSIAIIGGGAIGIEFASFFNALGSQVEVFEYSTKILSYADDDVIKWATNSFKKSGIKFHLGVEIESVISNTDGVIIKTKNSNSLVNAEKCMVATGITPNTDDIGLDAIAARLDRGHIITDTSWQTHESGVYAIGDVTAGPWLAHKAMQEGIRCVEGIMGINVQPLGFVPSCVYSIPQIAQIGFTEAQTNGKDVSVAIYPLKANGKALTENNDGFVKVIFEKKTGIFLGAHMVGSHVTELIHGYSIIHALEGVAEDVCKSIFPHPTLSEVIQEAVMSATGMGLHF